ncbi:hypothetical protein KDI_48480 [Dictyobacter arantiisoli]|uniref:Uncharacterized protein n=1 Tax=Dictyobacter arantiisoli TaxID=2014874 RepID=A0A5A5TK66_9CHLR|nr:hypothetical protein KDI_48480 [Dictyobacter arantiisoli]
MDVPLLYILSIAYSLPGQKYYKIRFCVMSIYIYIRIACYIFERMRSAQIKVISDMWRRGTTKRV